MCVYIAGLVTGLGCERLSSKSVDGGGGEGCPRDSDGLLKDCPVKE